MDDSDTELLTRASVVLRSVIADPAAAEPEVERLVGEARSARDPRALVAALRAQAWLERSRLAHGRALDLLDEAVRVARRHDLRPYLREALTARGVVRHELGRLTAAQRDFDRAKDLEGGDDPELESQQAALHQNAGRLADAAVIYRRLLIRADIPPQVLAKAANNLGMIEVQCGHPDEALAHFDAAAAAARQVGPAVVAIVAAGRAWATVHAGRLAEGVALFDEASVLWRRARLPLGELYAEYADALTSLRLVPEAEQQAQRAAALLERRGVALMAAEAQLRRARLALLRGEPERARAEADVVARRLGGQGRRTWRALARLVAADAALAGGTPIGADLSSARRAAATLERAGLVADAVEGHLIAGRLAAALDRKQVATYEWSRSEAMARDAPLLVRLKGRLAGGLSARLGGRQRAALVRARAGLDDLARHRAALPSAELRALASGYGAELGQLGLASIVRTGKPTDVLAWMERTRAAALAFVDPPEVADIEEELGVLRTLQSDIAAARREATPNFTNLLVQQAEVEDRIRKAAWRQRVALDGSDRPPSIAQLRAALDGRVLVEYDVLDGVVIAAVLERRRSRLVELGRLERVTKDLTDVGFALHLLCRTGRSTAAVEAARDSAAAGIAALRAQLVDPLDIPTGNGVVVVPVGDLQRAPWTALYEEPVAVTPSATLWIRTKERPPPPGGRVALIAGPELPGAVAEVEAIAQLHRGPLVLLPPNSTIAAVTLGMAGATLAHLACHGSIRADNPIFSSLLVSDGPLTLHELDRRGVAPHRLVLAACESSSDVVYAGNETLGFVSTLLAAGTCGLVASSVVVPDRNVVDLMTALHGSLVAGSTMAVALHQARATIDRDERAGFVGWCAFNAFGAA